MNRLKKIACGVLASVCIAAVPAIVSVGVDVARVDVVAAETSYTLPVKDGQDITTALQNAVKNYSNIVIPAGKYYCSGVKLNGVSGLTINATGATITLNSTANPILYVSNGATASDVHITGGVWDAGKQDLPALRFYGTATNVTLTKVTVQNSANAGIRFKESKNVKLDGVISKANGGYAVIFENSGNIEVSDSQLTTSKCGLYFKNCTGSIKATGVKCNENIDRGIYVEKCPNVVLTNAEVNYNGEGIRMSGVTGQLSLEEVNVKNNKGMGIRMFDCTAKLVGQFIYSYDNKAAGVSLENMTGGLDLYKVNAKRNASNGYYVVNCGEVVLNKCTSSNNSGNGASLNNLESLKVTSCTMGDNKSNGLRIDTVEKLWISKGEYSKNAQTGIALGNVGAISVKGISTHDNAGYGLNIDGIRVSGLVKDAKSYNNGNIGLRYKDSLGKINTQYSTVYNNGAAGIYGVNCENMVVNGVEVYNNAGFGVNATDSPLANVKYSNIHDNEDIGIRYYNCKKIIVTDCDSYNNVNAGIYADGCTTITFNLAEVKNNKGFGINVNNGTAVSTISCVAEGNELAGFRYDMCTRVKCEDSTAKNNGGAGLYGGDITQYIKMTNVKVIGNGEYGVNLNNVTGTATLKKVTAEGNASSGFFFNLSKAVTVSNSTSSKNGAHGVYVLDSNALLDEMIVSESYWCGLSANGTSCVVAVNGGKYFNNGTRPDRFENDDNLCAGIGVYAGATVGLANVYSIENHGCGLAVTGAEDGSAISYAEVYGCVFDNNGDHGIGARPYGKVNVSADSEGVITSICSNKHSGIMLNDYCTSDYIKGCVIKNNGKAGISVSANSKATLIEGITVAGNTEDGIHVSDKSEAVIKKCDISNNKLSGVGVYSSSTVSLLENCTISGNDSYGVCVDTSVVSSINKCNISENDKAGVVVRNSGNIKALKNCDVVKNGTYGIYCSDAGKVTVKKTYVAENVTDGIRVTGKKSKISLSDVEVVKNVANGIVVTKKGTAILNNITINNNGKHGLAIYADSTVKDVVGLSSSNNANRQVYVESGAITDLTTQK